MTKEKTEAQKYIDVLRAYYKASCELNEVALKYGDEFHRAAHKHMDALDKEIRDRLADWNEDASTAAYEHIIECIRASDCWDKKCEIFFTVAGDEHGRCEWCSEQKRQQDKWENAR